MAPTLRSLRRSALAACAVVALAPPLAGVAAAAPWPEQPTFLDQLMSPDAQCRGAIRRQEAASGIPNSLMTAISLVESGRWMPDGRYAAWPWSINVFGAGRVYQTKAQAIAGVRALLAAGVRSIDVGCMQVNLMHHPDAFATLDEAFDPVRNAVYAAGFLNRLRAQTGSWQAATADYHSATPELGVPYEHRVRAMMSQAAARVLMEPPHLSAGAPLGGMMPAPSLQGPSLQAAPFSSLRPLPVFFPKAHAQAIGSLATGFGRIPRGARNIAALDYRGQQARANWRSAN